MQQAQGKVAQLRCELLAAEREESVPKAVVTTHVLQSDPESKNSVASGGPTLGPTLRVEASVEGGSTKALIDTGSPVSLVSIDFLLHALIKNIDSGATQEHIMETLKARLEDPQLTVRNFGGDEVNVVGQTTVTLCCGEHTSQVTLLVQKGTQLDLLLGTDVLGKLGFQILQKCRNRKPYDLLSVGVRQEESTMGLSVAEEAVPGKVVTVKALKATRIPGCHCQLMRVCASTSAGMSKENMLLFNPTELGADDQQVAGTGITPCLVMPATDGIMVVAVENHNHHPIELEEGQLLGFVEPVNILSVAPEVCALKPTSPSVNTEDRISEVLWQLDIENKLEENHRIDLCNIVTIVSLLKYSHSTHLN